MKWPKVNLMQFCSPRQWPTISTKQLTLDGFPVYGANGQIGYYHSYNHEYPTILMTCRGATCGTINISPPKCYVTGNAMALDNPREDFIDFRFLFYALQSRGLKDVITGAAQPQITRASLSRVDIPLPPLTEQWRIVEILDQADTLRKKRADADAKAARILPAIFYKMFGDPATNPKGWPVLPIREMVTPVERRDPSVQPDKTFTYIDIAGIDGQLGVISGTKAILGEEAPSRARQIVRANDVIISTVRPYLRATALVPEQYDSQICSTGFCVLRANAGVGFGFLYILSRVQWFTDQLNARARGASYPAVTDADIFNLRILQPNNLDMLRRFDFQVLDALALLGKRREATRRLEDLFEMLLHHAFTGDLTAKWREAHMKEILKEVEIQSKILGTLNTANNKKA